MFDNIRVWFNNKGWAASMAYMNAINNVVLRASIKAQQDDLAMDWDDTYKDASRYEEEEEKKACIRGFRKMYEHCKYRKIKKYSYFFLSFFSLFIK